MVVDDEEAILDLYEKVLKRFGCEVTLATESLVVSEKDVMAIGIKRYAKK